MQQNPDISLELRPLFNLKEDSKPSDITGPLPNWYLRNPIYKKIAHTIKRWNEVLDQEIERCRRKRDDLSHLQDLIRPLSAGGKTGLLRQILVDYSSPSIEKAINRLELLILRAVTAESSQSTPTIIKASFLNPFVIVKPISPSIEKAQQKQREEARKEFISAQFRRLNPESGGNWFEFFIKAFKDVVDTQDIFAAVSDLNIVQLVELINYHLKDTAKYWKVPLILRGMHEDVVLDFLSNISEEELEFLNKALVSDNNRTCLSSLFDYWRDVLIKESNRIRDEIDTIADYARNTSIFDITPEEIALKIQSVRDSVDKMRKIKLHFSKLMQNLKIDAETRNIPNDIEAECTNHMNRILNSPNYENLPGNIYGILFRRAFDELDVEDEASEIISAWSLQFAEDYMRYFKIKPLNNEEAYKWFLNKLSVYKFKNIGDLKRMRFYNAHFFRHFLETEEKKMARQSAL